MFECRTAESGMRRRSSSTQKEKTEMISILGSRDRSASEKILIIPALESKRKLLIFSHLGARAGEPVCAFSFDLMISFFRFSSSLFPPSITFRFFLYSILCVHFVLVLLQFFSEIFYYCCCCCRSVHRHFKKKFCIDPV